MRACNNYFESQALATAVIRAYERKKRLKLKRIVVSEHNYLALKTLGHAGDSFNDLISKLIQIHGIHQEEKQQLQPEQQNRDEENAHNIIGDRPYPEIFSEPLNEEDRQRLDVLLDYSRKDRRNNQPNKQESNNPNDAVKKVLPRS